MKSGIVINLASILLVINSAYAFSISLSPWGKIVRWAKSALTYYLDPNGAPGISDNSDISAVKSSFQDWQNVTCSSLTFQYLGETTNKNVLPISGVSNNKNELVWITNSAWKFGQLVLGVTVPLYDMTGEIHESDIAFNGYLQQWSTTGDIWKTDVKSVAIHEIGHFFGLQHVLNGYDPYNPPTMAPAADPYGKTASLEEDDKLGACFLYPEGGKYTCTKDNQCPKIVDTNQSGEEYYSGQMKCEMGTCNKVVAPGSVGFGGTCSKTSDCASGYSCYTIDSGAQICTLTCNPNNDTCPSGFHCKTQSSTNVSLCVVGAKKGKVGDPCTYSLDCETYFCYQNPSGTGSSCRIACNKNENNCPQGQVCWVKTSFGSVGGCFDESEVPAKKGIGEPCISDADCKSNICVVDQNGKFLCRRHCTKNGNECGEDEHCEYISYDKYACMPGPPPQPPKKETDALCTENEECESGWCVNLIGTNQNYCRKHCSLEDWACDWGWACVSYGSTEIGVCMPSIGKKDTGEACKGPSECLTWICWKAEDEEHEYCTQNCIDGWCPNGMECVDAGYYGMLCKLPPDVEPKIEETDIEIDESNTDEEEAEEETIQEEQPTKPTKSSGGGCYVSSNQTTEGLCILFLQLLLIVALRMFRKQRDLV